MTRNHTFTTLRALRGTPITILLTLYLKRAPASQQVHTIADHVHDGRFQLYHNVGRSVRAALAWPPQTPNPNT
jgi:hypothetical protein